ncbi:MAG: hypothetical protein K6F53_12950 [Lachnospiraceae bacterium]|nr:hypothetical protein [Lachnospiraceae bacterium]
MDKKSRKTVVFLGAVVIAVLCFAAGFFAGSRSRRGEGTSKEGTGRGAKTALAAESGALEDLSHAQYTPTAITGDREEAVEHALNGESDPEETAAAELPELTDANCIVSAENGMYTYDMMCEDMYALCGKYPEILQYTYVGTSFDDRNLYAITLGSVSAPHHIMAVASINGSEHMTTLMVMKMLEYYAYYYNVGSYKGIAFSELFENTSVRVLLMGNPDGVTIAQLGASALNHEEFAAIVQECYEKDKWYLEYRDDGEGARWVDHYDIPEFNVKLSENPEMISFEDYQKLWNANAYGVDISRNFAGLWEESAYKAESDYAGYKGPSAMSEVETALIYSYALDMEHDYYIRYTGGSNPVGAGDAAGSFEEWLLETCQKECITVPCGRGLIPYPAADLQRIYEENRDGWAHLCYNIKTGSAG